MERVYPCINSGCLDSCSVHIEFLFFQIRGSDDTKDRWNDIMDSQRRLWVGAHLHSP